MFPMVYLDEAIIFLTETIKDTRRNLFMPGDGRYQPAKLKPYLGYDQWALWLVVVEWFWLQTLSRIGEMPVSAAQFLTADRLKRSLRAITTTKQDKIEKKTGHDINALLELMRKYLPKRLANWLHFCATSYDIINTAYALQLKITFKDVIWPKLKEIDKLWREKIAQYAEQIQCGRTHLQTALPITVGFWLANLHNQFVKSARNALNLSRKVPGKFSGAVGTHAAQRALFSLAGAEEVVLKMLGLPVPDISSQITAPQDNARFYFELLLLSGVLGNLGDDVRIMQSSEFGECMSHGSTSSTMSHKKANPVLAEQMVGMHTNVIAENMKIILTLTTNFQRDLRWSSVMRSFSAVMVYMFQQLLTAERMLRSFSIDSGCCVANFFKSGKLVLGELLHLSLQREGYQEAHPLVNREIVPIAAESGYNLAVTMDNYLFEKPNEALSRAWQAVPQHVKRIFPNPEFYLGDAITIAKKEAENAL